MAEDSDLKFHEGTEVNFTDKCLHGCPKSDRQQTTTTNRLIHHFCKANLKPVRVEFIGLTFSPFLYIKAKFGSS
jgi:hypothetical protein